MSERVKRTCSRQNPGNQLACESAEKVMSIEELLTEILLRVPIKPLACFKSVSKHWLSLITSPQFCTRRNPNPNSAIGILFNQRHHGLIVDSEYIPLYPESRRIPNAPPPVLELLEYTPRPKHSHILQSCNGLLLCSNSDPQSIHIPYPQCYYVCNPTTKQFATLPPCVTNSPCEATLVFQPLESPHYKVVLLSLAYSMYVDYMIEVYSSKTQTWSKLPAVIIRTARGEFVFGNGVYWNGSVHWISTLTRLGLDSLRFHVDSLVYSSMPSPPVMHKSGRRGSYYFGTSGDHLHYIEHGPQLDTNGTTTPWYAIYEIKRDYSEWFVTYKVDFTPIIAACPKILKHHNHYLISILSLVRGYKDDEDAMLVLRTPDEFIRFNLADGSLTTLCKMQSFIQEEYDSCLIGACRPISGYRFHGESTVDYIESVCGV